MDRWRHACPMPAANLCRLHSTTVLRVRCPACTRLLCSSSTLRSARPAPTGAHAAAARRLPLATGVQAHLHVPLKRLNSPQHRLYVWALSHSCPLALPGCPHRDANPTPAPMALPLCCLSCIPSNCGPAVVHQSPWPPWLPGPPCRDPYRNDINFVLSMFTLEEVGATLSAGAVGELGRRSTCYGPARAAATLLELPCFSHAHMMLTTVWDRCKHVPARRTAKIA